MLRIITLLFVSLFGICAIAQQQDVNIELDEPITGGQHTYTASQSIRLLPGFLYQPLQENDYFKGEIDPFEVIPPSEGTIGGPLTDDDGHVGSLAADYTISDNGTFSYSVEINVPPGRAGMTPEVFLTYNSGVPDGLLGLGWSISSLSSISHTALTYHHDGSHGFYGGDFLNSALMLDGVRLFPIGVNEYRKETDDFARIEKIYPGYGYYFKVTSKSGLIYEYGRTMASTHRCITNQSPGIIQKYAYYLSSVRDNYGNQISYNYTTNQNTGEIYLDNIEYLENKIEFQYESIEDRSIAYYSYMLGGKGALTIQSAKILNKISIKQNNQLLWEYLLDYEQRNILSDPDNMVRLLKSIQKVISSGEKYNSTKFFWDEPVEYGQTNPMSYQINISPNTNKNYIYYGKFFGNASSDLILSNKFGDNQILSVYRNVSGQLIPFGDVYGHVDIKNGSVIVGDYNGDGFDDFIHYEYRDRVWYFYSYINDGNGNFTRYKVYYGTPLYPRDIIPGDFNGDGIADILFRTEPAGELHFLLGDPNNSSNGHLSPGMNSPRKFIDPKLSISPGHFTGSNRTELFGRGRNESDDWVQNIYTFEKDVEYYSLKTIEIAPESILKGADLSFADLNGDGKTDFIDFRDTQDGPTLYLEVEMFHTYGSDVIPSGVQNIKIIDEYSANYDGHYVSNKLIGDFNGDGRSDALVEVTVSYKYEIYDPYSGEWYDIWNYNTYLVYLYTSKTGRSITAKIIEGNLGKNTLALDFSGNGAHDIVTSSFVGNSPGNYLVHSSDRYRIRKVVDGVGKWVSIDYSTTADQSVYLGSTGTYSYPNAASTITFPVVASVTTSNGFGGSIKTSYSYQGALLNLQGLGLLGYKHHSSRNHEFDIMHVKSAELIENFSIFLPISNSKRIFSTGRLITRSNFKYDIIKSTSKNTYFIAQNEILEEHYEPEGSSEPYKSSKMQFKDFDEYGNPLIIVNETSKGGNTFVTETKRTTINRYHNYVGESKWILGRLYMAETTFEYLNEPPITKKVSFTYYENGKDIGMLKDEIIEPGTDLSHQKTYTYDEYGNILSTEFNIGNGYENRIQSTEYDPDTQNNNSIFATRHINSMGHTERFEYEYAYGNLVKSYCPNNNLTENEYNVFGNLTKTISPEGNQHVSVLRWVQPDDNLAPANAVYLLWEKSSFSTPSIIYMNNKGDELRTIRQNFNGTRVFTDKVYNELGQLVMQSAPYFEGENNFHQRFEYDNIGRLEKTIMPHHTGEVATSISYNGLKSTVTNPLGQTISKEYNSAGWIINSTDSKKNKTLTFYYSDGLLKEKQIEGATNTTRSYEYDLRGNLIKYQDMAQGELTYLYNGFGEIIEETNARGMKTEYRAYDKLGRPLVIEAPEGIKLFTYDSGKIGLVDNIESPNHKVEYEYDEFLRITNVNEEVDGESFMSHSDYDHFGRPVGLTFPENYNIIYHYNEFGYNSSITEKEKGTLIWEGDMVNANDQFTKINLGEKITQILDYWDETGRIKSQLVDKVQDNYYVWDGIGNLEFRKSRSGIDEEFDYDELNRLTKVFHNGLEKLSMNYDNFGNITYKSDVGNYFYEDPLNPYKLTRIDKVPNTIDNDLQEVLYNSFNKVREISAKDPISGRVNRRLEIFYGVGNERVKQVYEEDDLIRTQFFIGSTYEKEILNDKITNKYYISSPSGLVAVMQRSEGIDELSYIVSDHLGSVQVMLSVEGELLEEFSYDPWGLRRDPASLEVFGYSSMPDAGINKGFTGHQHIDAFMLVNMNGRMYDPVLGRFLSPDPVLQFPNYSQGLNPYSYTLNNPLRFVDPSGYSINDNTGFAFYQGIGSAMTTMVLMGAGLTPAGLIAAFIITAINITTISMAKGAPTRDAIEKGLTAGALTVMTAVGSAGIGEVFKEISFTLKRGGVLLKEITRAGAHGTMNGTIRWAQGGRFMHGFSSGFVSSLGGSFMQSNGGKMSAGTQIAMSAVIGGTAEALGGGKFANGAVTGAYVMMLNHLMHPPQTQARKSLLNNIQIEALQSKIKDVTFSHRSSWSRYDGATMDSAPIWEVSLDISGVEYGKIYTAENVEIWLGNETLTVDIDYFPNKAHSKVNMIDAPGVDFTTGGRLFLQNKNFDGHIMEIKFRNSTDFAKFDSFIKAHDLKKLK